MPRRSREHGGSSNSKKKTGKRGKDQIRSSCQLPRETVMKGDSKQNDKNNLFNGKPVTRGSLNTRIIDYRAMANAGTNNNAKLAAKKMEKPGKSAVARKLDMVDDSELEPETRPEINEDILVTVHTTEDDFQSENSDEEDVPDHEMETWSHLDRWLKK